MEHILCRKGFHKMDELLRIMSEIKPDVDFDTATTLIDDDMIDSLDIIAIVSEVNDTFDIEIDVNDLMPENFNSAESLWNLICNLQEE